MLHTSFIDDHSEFETIGCKPEIFDDVFIIYEKLLAFVLLGFCVLPANVDFLWFIYLLIFIQVGQIKLVDADIEIDPFVDNQSSAISVDGCQHSLMMKLMHILFCLKLNGLEELNLGSELPNIDLVTRSCDELCTTLRHLDHLNLLGVLERL